MRIHLKKGRTALELTIPDEKVAQVLDGPAIPAMDTAELQTRVRQGVRTHAPADIGGKQIAILIPDDTRLWARGDLVVPQIVAALEDLGVGQENIKIIIALGTHEGMPPSQFPRLAGSSGDRRVTILNSANRDRTRLVTLGTTSRGTAVTLTREAVDADHIIIFGGILHHLLAGYGGGRKYILPGIAGYDSVQQNHSLAITATGNPHPRVQPASLAGNPVHEDLEEAADLFLQNKTCTYVAVAANGVGELFHCQVGSLRQTFLDGCTRLDEACSVAIPAKADFALISAGGYRTDGQLYQATKALFNAVNAVKTGGEILFVAGCAQGVGNPVFADALIAHKSTPAVLGRRLAEQFDMPAYVALRLMDLLQHYRITLVSDLDPALVKDLGFNTIVDAQACVNALEGQGHLIPFAENILPIPEADARR